MINNSINPTVFLLTDIHLAWIKPVKANLKRESITPQKKKSDLTINKEFLLLKSALIPF